MDAVRTALSLTLATAFLAAPFPARPLPAGYPPEQSYSLALHIHGSMSEQYGSMEWHTAKAESIGVDFIWWSDHDWRLTNFRHMNKYDFETAVWEAPLLRWTEVDDVWPTNYRYWQTDLASMAVVQTSISDTLAWEGNRSFVLEAVGQPGPSFVSGYLDQSTMHFTNRTSLTKRIALSFALYPESLDPQDTRFVLEVELSDHPAGPPILRYVAGSLDGEGAHSTPLPFTPGAWNEYTVHVTDDAIQHFSAGGPDTLRAEDNTLGMVRIGLETRNGASARVLFDGYRIAPDSSLVGDILLNRARAIGSYYETLYPGVAHYAGTEISKFRGAPHLNGFAPDLELVDYTGHVWSDSIWYAVDQIHEQGGAVSLNHVFGPRFHYQDNPDETPAQQAARVVWTKRQMIALRVWNADVLEVGYRRRGGMDLIHHLELWDAINGNAIWITGNGVTDSHGRGDHNLIGWGPDGDLSTTNNFVTWLATEAVSEAGFVQAMKRGRAWFGDPYLWQGALDLETLDGFRMGQVVFTDRDQHDLAVTVENVPADVQVRLLQVEIRENASPEYTTLNVLRDEVLAGAVTGGTFADTVALDTSLPCFARVEVRDGAGEGLVYSNPIHFVRSVPLLGIPAERVGVRAGEVRVFLAGEFTLTGAAFDAGTQILTITGDEETPGLGTLSIDPGALGEPTGVVGADGWTWTDGTLALTGFSGTGSAIQVTWGATGIVGTGPGDVGGLRLGPGRPNPFGEGMIAEYSLPRAGPVRLELFDVAGRRIRVLESGARPAGVSRAGWDGRDESGVPAAAGVYWLRLSFEDDRRVRKVVKVRAE